MGFSEKYAVQKTEDSENNENNKLKADKKQDSNTTKGAEPHFQQAEAQFIIKSPLMLIKQFIKVLSSPFYDGRVLLNIDQSSKSTLKFMLLNPDACFEEIVKQARSIILAGGTMKPVSCDT
jgi:chromosome transmission fidelity protein 1